MARITTNDPPVGTPKRASGTVGTSLATIISVDDYEVTRTVSGSVTSEVRTGVAELATPLFLCNRTGTARWVSVQITRSTGSSGYVIFEQSIPPRETLQVALNGQMLTTGDALRLVAEAANAIDYTISWTQGEAESNDGS
jgi:hypothetical protein